MGGIPIPAKPGTETGETVTVTPRSATTSQTGAVSGVSPFHLRETHRVRADLEPHWGHCRVNADPSNRTGRGT